MPFHNCPLPLIPCIVQYSQEFLWPNSHPLVFPLDFENWSRIKWDAQNQKTLLLLSVHPDPPLLIEWKGEEGDDEVKATAEPLLKY